MDERYVSKEEVKPFRRQFHEWMKKIRGEIKEEGISFTYMLVGSAKRNLVIRHHNKGFDCDYQIRITKNKNGYKAEKIKHLFMNALNGIVENYGYSNCENSSSSITIKMIGNNSNIVHSYDVVVLQQHNKETKILRYRKPPVGDGSYDFELLPNMSDFADNLRKINGSDRWKKLRGNYYKKKINELTENRTGKKSFQLLNEAVKEVLSSR